MWLDGSINFRTSTFFTTSDTYGNYAQVAQDVHLADI